VLRLQFVLFQMDEARRLIDEAHLSALRLALLLLDNAAEVLLDRWTASSLMLDGVDRRLQASARSWGASANDPTLADLFSRTPLNARQVRNIARFFDEKIAYATTKSALSPSVGSALSHLHRYRNRAHHHADVNEQTLRTSVIILFELCCQLVLTLKPGMIGHSSREDYSWLQRRFGAGPGAFWDDARLQEALDSMRVGLPISDASLGQTLADNLLSRIDEVLESLDFLVNTAQVEMNQSDVLAAAQGHALDAVQQDPPYESIPKGLELPVSVAELDAISLAAQHVASSPDCVSAVVAFAEPDKRLERVEFMVDGLARAVDEMIQNEVDAALGK